MLSGSLQNKLIENVEGYYIIMILVIVYKINATVLNYW